MPQFEQKQVQAHKYRLTSFHRTPSNLAPRRGLRWGLTALAEMTCCPSQGQIFAPETGVGKRMNHQRPTHAKVDASLQPVAFDSRPQLLAIGHAVNMSPCGVWNTALQME